MENGSRTVIGIVISESSEESKCWIWWKKVGHEKNNQILFINPENPVKIGDWVEITITEQEYKDSFLPDDSLQFVVTDYIVIPQIYKTTFHGADIRVTLEQVLTENQAVVEHHFFGKISNFFHQKFPLGTYTLTIRLMKPPNLDMVWVLERVERVQEPPKDAKIRIIGIVVYHLASGTYVWCKERRVGKDITVKKLPNGDHLPMGTWITFTVDNDIFKRVFPHEFSGGGYLPEYEIREYDIMKNPIHPTGIRNNEVVYMKVECYVEKNEEKKDVWHPFVGLIRNKYFEFPATGKYSITIMHAFEPSTNSIWYLSKRELILENPQQSLRKETNIDTELGNMSLNGSSDIPVDEPSTSHLAASQTHFRPMPITDENGSKKFGKDHCVARDAPVSHIPSTSRPEPSLRISVVRKAVVYKMFAFKKKEIILFWLFDNHADGRLELELGAAEKYGLRLGVPFSAEFVVETNTWIPKPVEPISDPSYRHETESNDLDGVDFRLFVAGLLKKTTKGGYEYSIFYHPNFGDILDVYDRSGKRECSEYLIWIRRMQFYDQFQWVVQRR